MADQYTEPIQLLPIFRERVWGRETLAPYFGNAPLSERIGEVWFTFEENRTSSNEALGELLQQHPKILGNAADPKHPGICPILVKLLFTTSRLSVQVHPDDEYAHKHHGSLGKTEAWYVLEADPPGEIAVGFREPISPERLRESAGSGEIENLLDWRKVQAGDVIFTPAGTVHAIGAGLTICEIQENSDITYRLYDYGRPRELHLDHGANVSHLDPQEHQAATRSVTPWRDELVACEYFRIERLRPAGPIQVPARLPYYHLLICVKGTGSIGGRAAVAGEAWLVPADADGFTVDGAGSEWILTYTAAEMMVGLHAA
jgi:mannose-6-phosphate isomerase